MEDFTGFTFGGVHSSDLGIIRVSGGDRYDEQLHPEIKDRTAEVPGLNGDYYFGSDFGPRSFDIEIAFDSLTEEQFRKLRRVFGTKDIKQLIFDERPYKYYMAKLESPMELSYVCFDEPKKTVGPARDGIRVTNREITITSTVADVTEGLEVSVDSAVFQNIFTTDGNYPFAYRDSIWYIVEDEEMSEVVLENYGITATLDPGVTEGSFVITNETSGYTREQVTPYIRDFDHRERIYKGEGKMSFICHFPFAKSVYKVLPSEEEESNWAISSGILNSEDYSAVDIYENEAITIYNAGDLATGFRLYLPSSAAGAGITLKYQQDSDVSETSTTLVLDSITLKDGDVGVIVDTNSGLIVGVSVAPTLNPITGLWSYTTSGNLYNEYINSGYFFKLEPNINSNDRSILQIENGTEGIVIFYDYLYF